jgi:hypothetical protein
MEMKEWGPHWRQLEQAGSLAAATRPRPRVSLTWTGPIDVLSILDNRVPDPSRRRLVCALWDSAITRPRAKPADQHHDQQRVMLLDYGMSKMVI